MILHNVKMEILRVYILKHKGQVVDTIYIKLKM